MTAPEDDAVVASGGWCAPSGLTPHLFGPLTPEEVAALPDPEPDPLPEGRSRREVWVVTDGFGDEDVVSDEAAARRAFEHEVSRSEPWDAVALRRRVVEEEVVEARHGERPPPDPDAPPTVDEHGFPLVAARRGGAIVFRGPE